MVFMPTIKQIQHFQAVFRAGTAQGAARTVHVSQPALSRSITQLEEELGVKLFERSKSGMLPTEFAEKIAPRYEQLLLVLEDIRREALLHTSLELGEMRIGFGQAVRELLTRHCIPPFVSRFPGVAITVQEGTAPELVRALQQRDVDMILAGVDSYRQYEFIRSERIVDIPVTVVVRKGHPLAGRARVELKDILRYPQASPTSLGEHHPFRESVDFGQDDPASPQFLCSDYSVLESIVQCTDAWTVTLDSNLSPEPRQSLRKLDVAGFDITIQLSVIELKNRSRSPAASQFIEIVKSKFGDDQTPVS